LVIGIQVSRANPTIPVAVSHCLIHVNDDAAARCEVSRMARKILVINGHPDSRPQRFCAALASTYADAAGKAGHEVRRIDVGALSFPLLTRNEDFSRPSDNPDIVRAQDDIRWAEHLAFVFPLWLGAAPALLKGFLEMVARGGFGFDTGAAGSPHRGLKKKSARLIVTMGMPASAFRLIFGGFGVRAFERGILRLAGAWPVHKTYCGAIELSENHRASCLKTVAALGERGV
jgi:putative NADPH-quinone reductase